MGCRFSGLNAVGIVGLALFCLEGFPELGISKVSSMGRSSGQHRYYPILAL